VNLDRLIADDNLLWQRVYETPLPLDAGAEEELPHLCNLRGSLNASK
jgi:hypothetical protein